MSGVTESASAGIRAALHPIADEVIERQSAQWPDLNASLSEHQARKMMDDIRYHLEFIASSLWFEQQVLLDDYAVWCKVLFANLNMPAEWFTGSFECIADVLDGRLPDPEAAIARSYIEGALETFRSASTATTSFIVPGSALGDLARRHLYAVLEGRRAEAILMLDDEVKRGTPVREIYLQVLQPVQREVGRLWQLNQISVEQEHYVTAVTQVVMAHLNDRLVTGQDSGRTVVTACVGGEQHELGARMVADFFEMDGWNARFLGANTPNSAVIGAVRATRPDVLALSATMTSHVVNVAEIILALRADSELAETRVLVGGYSFNVAPDLWRRIGADGYAPDAETAPVVAQGLTAA
jgi:methanogenic corrinoid protein MtbC1